MHRNIQLKTRYSQYERPALTVESTTVARPIGHRCRQRRAREFGPLRPLSSINVRSRYYYIVHYHYDDEAALRPTAAYPTMHRA